MGSAIALREKRALVPDTPVDRAELVQELRELITKLQVIHVLQSWKAAMQHIWSKTTAAHAFLLKLDQQKNEVTITGFKKEQMLLAQDAYLRIEKETATNRHIQVVLVSVGSLQALRSAYPSYFLDTDAFIREIMLAAG